MNQSINQSSAGGTCLCVQWGAMPLEDNLPTDNYHYQVAVYTGVRKNAGTDSRIRFIMSGDEADTGVRRMFDGKRKVHQIRSDDR